MPNVRELFEQLYERSIGESIPEELQKALSAQAFQTNLPDGLDSSILGGLYNKATATNDPEIAGKIMGAKFGAIDKVLKPILVKHLGWTEQQYNEKRKEKSGNTLDITLDFIRNYGESVDNAVKAAIKERGGLNEQQIRDAIQSEFQSKLDASVSTNKQLTTDLQGLQNQLQEQTKQFDSERKDIRLTYWLDSQLGGYKIQQKLLDPLVEGAKPYWQIHKPEVLNQLKKSYAWVENEDGTFMPMNPQDPTMRVLSTDKKEMGAADIFQSTLSPYLATNDNRPPNGGSGNSNPNAFINPPANGGNGNKVQVGTKVGQAQLPTSWD